MLVFSYVFMCVQLAWTPEKISAAAQTQWQLSDIMFSNTFSCELILWAKGSSILYICLKISLQSPALHFIKQKGETSLWKSREQHSMIYSFAKT